MFGIKTKKDKTIEELKESIKKRDEIIERLSEYGRPYYIREKIDLIPVRATYAIMNALPIEVIKDQLAYRMVEFLKDEITYEVIDIEGRKTLEGTLWVRKGGK